jgi:methylmalonyl-CoA carboxyltransferase large subunit
MTVLVTAGFAVLYFGLRRTLLAAMSARQMAMEHQLDSLAAAVRMLEGKVAEAASTLEPEAAIASEFTMTAASAEVAPEPETAFAEQAIYRSDEEVTPEMMLVIAAAVTEFLGKKVRILSAKQLHSPREALSPWSQQGRVFVQASHNLRMG